MPPKAGAGARARSKSGSRTTGAKATAKPRAVTEAVAGAASIAAAGGLPAELASYDGTAPLSIEDATSALRATCRAGALKGLGATTSADEQLPARMMMEFVGDKDTSWENAQKSLSNGEAFIKEILEMDGARHVTKGSIARLEELGHLCPQALGARFPAAFAMAAYLEAVVAVAKERLGLGRAAEAGAPAPEEKPPEWPITIDFKQLPQALNDAVKWKKTPLFVCNGKGRTVDTFFSYQGFALVDAKNIIGMVDIKKEMDVPSMREKLRNILAQAIKSGTAIQIAMGNTAASFKSRYCDPDFFPEALFNNEFWFQQDNYGKIFRDEDLKNWPGAFPGRMLEEGVSFTFITTDFTLENAREFLGDALPYLDDMAVIEIDPTSIDD